MICGYGRVGHLVATALQRRGFGFVVVDESPHAVRDAREDGIAAIRGSVENRVVLDGRRSSARRSSSSPSPTR